MRKIIILACFVFVHFYVFSQTVTIKGKIIDSKTGKGLPYTNVSVLNKAIGTSSDKAGFFEINLPDSLTDDTLVFSYIGYKQLKTSINKSKNLSIKLKQSEITLNEIVVKPSKNRKKITVNKLKKRKSHVRYEPIVPNDSSSLWIPHRAKEPTVEAAYFPYKENYKSVNRIKEIQVCLKNWVPNSKCRLRIFGRNTKKMPANDLLYTPLYITATKTGKQIVKIDMNKYNLSLPKSGLFIGIETLTIPENKEVITADNKTATIYCPFLEFGITEEANYKYYIYAEGIWSVESKKTNSNSKKKSKYYKPAISLILTD